MGRPKRQYPLGKYRLRTPKEVDKEKAYPVELEYTWNRQVIRKTTNVFVKMGIRGVVLCVPVMGMNTSV